MYLVHHLHFIIILNNKAEKKNKLINNASDLAASSNSVSFAVREKRGGKKPNRIITL